MFVNLIKEITVIAFYVVLYKKIYKQEKKTCKTYTKYV